MVPELFDWMARGNCRGKPTAMWFPASGDGAAARALCATCPVAAECLEYALTDEPAPEGIWAGTDERERAGMRKLRRLNSASVAA
jgi:WhiB family redox-sensing transcriptional regulator